MVTSANDNATYHLSQLDGARMVMSVAGKQIKVFKKLQEVQPDLGVEDEDVNKYEESKQDRFGYSSEEDN